MRRLAILSALAACAPSAPARPAAPAKLSPAFVPPMLGRLVAAPTQPGIRICSSTPAAAVWPAQAMLGKTREYDFTAIPIALAFGPPPTTVQAPPAFVRYGDTIRVAIIAETDRFAACVHATIAARHPDRIAVDLAFTVDPFGGLHDITVDGTPAFQACFAETLGAVRVNRRTARETHAKVRLSLVGLGSVKRDGAPPVATVRHVRPGCMIASDPLPIDTVELAGVEIDFDPDAVTSHGRARRCRENSEPDKAELRAMVRVGTGNLRACYVAAAARTPNLAGTLTTEWWLGPWGQPTNVIVAGAGDEALHACIKTELELMATPRMPEAPLLVKLPFSLDPAPHVWARAEDALQAGDGDAAVTLFAQAARAATDLDQACRARLGIIEAYALAGWSEPRSEAAIGELGALLRAHATEPSLAACREAAQPMVVAVAEFPARTQDLGELAFYRGRGLEEAVARAQRITASYPGLEHALLPFIARGLTSLRRTTEAKRAYLDYFALGDPDRARVEVAAEGYAEAAAIDGEEIQWDPCEARQRPY